MEWRVVVPIVYKDKEYMEMESDFQTFCKMEREWELQCYFEEVGMIMHAELTSEPFCGMSGDVYH